MAAVKERKAKRVKSNNDESIMGLYLKDINRIPLLSREDEDNTAKAAAQGDLNARNKLINSNLRFVIAVAKKYQGRGLPLEDLINEGNIGLIIAVEKYDAARGYHFISYAVWWIRQSILKALYEKSRLIRLPVNQTNDLIHIEKVRERLDEHLHGDNLMREIAQILNVKENYVSDIMTISREVVSLEKLVDTDYGNSFTLGSSVVDNRYDAPDQELMKKSLADDIEAMLDTLDNKEAEIIRLHFGLGKHPPMSLKEIGEQFNLTKERIRQIEEKALLRLQHLSRREKLAAYVA